MNMQNFTIEKTFEKEDGSDLIEVRHYSADLDAGIAKIYSLDDNDENPVVIVVQPWKPLGDGTREEWTDIREVIDWFKAAN
jgi:hypothetical protein